jgi:hypothetical protein
VSKKAPQTAMGRLLGVGNDVIACKVFGPELSVHWWGGPFGSCLCGKVKRPGQRAKTPRRKP